MKCIAAVVMIAFVAGASAHVTPLVYSAPSVAYQAAPLTYATNYATKYVASPAITQYSSVPERKYLTTYAAQAPVVTYSAPTVYQSAPVYAEPTYTKYVAAAPLAYTTKVVAAPAPLTYATKVVAAPAPLAYTTKVVAAPVVAAPVAYTAVQEEAKYTAVNRGAVHEAPLPGHTLSQTSLNLAPAAK
ncbi:adult cuticle protein 1-like [Culicoides brevitarsis]|uniref:adult cuticle protein 1-like n=1 Tax=Culicoides brevitarsis TaxID=469753 RepID=UPI00307BECF9